MKPQFVMSKLKYGCLTYSLMILLFKDLSLPSAVAVVRPTGRDFAAHAEHILIYRYIIGSSLGTCVISIE